MIGTMCKTNAKRKVAKRKTKANRKVVHHAVQPRKKTKRKVGVDRKLSAKQENAVQLFLLCGNKAKAYKGAFNTKAVKYLPVYAWKEFEKPHMKKRVAELQERAVYEHLVTKDILAREFDEARDLAILAISPAAAVSASIAKAKLYGLITDKVQQNITGLDKKPLFPENITIEVVSVNKDNENN